MSNIVKPSSVHNMNVGSFKKKGGEKRPFHGDQTLSYSHFTTSYSTLEIQYNNRQSN